jgi:DNA ligase-4
MHEEVMEIFDKYMLDRSEGAVLKDLKSPYLPGNAARKKGHWLKLKPDYIDGMGENLDLIILGCYYSEGCTYRSGGISHFVVGVAAGQVGEEGKPTRFHTLCKVGSGFSLLELTRIRKRFGGLKKDGRGGHLEEWRADNLPPHFARCADNPSGWVPAKNDDIPDVWIEPQFSITIEVRGANIVSSTSWSAKMVVRFPRLKRIRDDKEWYECMTMQEVSLCFLFSVLWILVPFFQLVPRNPTVNSNNF